MISQDQIRAELNEYDKWLFLNWNSLNSNDVMKQVVLETRHEWIVDLQNAQLREYKNG